MNRFKSIISFLFVLWTVYPIYSQCIRNPSGDSPMWIQPGSEGNPEACVNALPTSMPFLLIAPDARSAGMGDVGIATDVDANKMHHNQSMLAFSNQNVSISATYTPWLQSLLNDVYLAYLSGYYKLDALQTVGLGLRYFSYGTINFTDDSGADIGLGQPYEMEFNLAYARKLSERLSAALGAKYLYSNLAAGQSIGNTVINAATSVAADISLTYNTPLNMASALSSDLTIGLTINNIGSKVSYTQSAIKNNIPTNFNLGGAWKVEFDSYNRLTVGLDLHKLLVPTPIPPDHPNYDLNTNNIPDYLEKSVVSGIFSSFGDAPNGFSEELQEFQWSLGAEYWYNDQFAVRAGYFNEARTKGNRQYLTFGAGIKYNVYGLNFSYLLATNAQNNPLNNTFRFSMIFDINALDYDEDQN